MTYLCVPHQRLFVDLVFFCIGLLAAIFAFLLCVVLGIVVMCDIRKRAADAEEPGKIRE